MAKTALSASAKRWTLIAAVLGSSIVFLDSTVATLTLPQIGRQLPRLFLSVGEGQFYVYTAYLLTLSSLLILAGSLNDLFGRRRMFILGLAGFGVTSIGCGLAFNLEFLVAMRILQGLFGAMLVPGSLALITVNFDGEEQGHAFGVWAGASAGTAVLGPLVGGVLVDLVTWRAAFLLNVPLVALALWAAFTFVPESRDEHASRNLDWWGAVLVAVAIGGFTFGAVDGAQHGWTVVPIGFLLVGAVVAASIPFYMRAVSNPLIPMALFKFRNFTITNISTLVIYGALYVSGFFSALFLQGTIGYTAAAAGLAGLPGFILLALFSARVGKFSAKYGPRIFMTVGPTIMAVGIFWLSRIPASTQPWLFSFKDTGTLLPPPDYWIQVLPGYLIFGAGLTLLVAPLTTALMTSVPARNSGVASAFNNAISRVGPQLAGAAIYIAIASSFYTGLMSHLPNTQMNSSVRANISALNMPTHQQMQQAFAGQTMPSASAFHTAALNASTDAFHLAMYVALGLLLTGALVNGVGIDNKNRRPDASEAPEPEAA